MKANKAASAVGLVALLLLALVLVFLVRSKLAYTRERTEKEELAQKAVPAFMEAAKRAAERRQLDAAVDQLNLVLRYDPDNLEARLLKGQISVVRKDFAGARADLDRYLRQHPADGDAKRLLDLCQRPRPEDAGYLLDVAQVFERKNVPALADVLLTRHGSNSFDARKKLLELYRKRIEAAWPGLGPTLTMDQNGIYTLNMDRCTQVRTLEPLEGMPLTALNIYMCGPIADLSPLKGMPLADLYLGALPNIQDITPLKDLPLTSLTLYACPISDLEPLRGMKLRVLRITYGSFKDLTPLQGMPLTSLDISGSFGLQDLTPLQGLKLTSLQLSPRQVHTKGMSALRSMKSLQTIGIEDKTLPAPEFWKKYDAGEFGK